MLIKSNNYNNILYIINTTCLPVFSYTEKTYEKKDLLN